MKITPMLPGSRNDAVQTQNQTSNTSSQETVSTPTSLSADDITQQGLSAAQQTLNAESQDDDVDYDKVAQMQAALASDQLQVNTNDLASAMLSFYQK